VHVYNVGDAQSNVKQHISLYIYFAAINMMSVRIKLPHLCMRVYNEGDIHVDPARNIAIAPLSIPLVPAAILTSARTTQNKFVLLIQKESPPYVYMGESFTIDVITMKNDVDSPPTKVQLPLPSPGNSATQRHYFDPSSHIYI
jgi:hypothetical protein